MEKIERGSKRLQRTREEKESTRSSRKVDEAAVLLAGGGGCWWAAYLRWVLWMPITLLLSAETQALDMVAHFHKTRRKHFLIFRFYFKETYSIILLIFCPFRWTSGLVWSRMIEWGLSEAEWYFTELFMFHAKNSFSPVSLCYHCYFPFRDEPHTLVCEPGHVVF